jgi:hypothetical protein
VLATVQVLRQPHSETDAAPVWTDQLGPSPSRQPAADVGSIVEAARRIHKLD